MWLKKHEDVDITEEFSSGMKSKAVHESKRLVRNMLPRYPRHSSPAARNRTLAMA